MYGLIIAAGALGFLAGSCRWRHGRGRCGHRRQRCGPSCGHHGPPWARHGHGQRRGPRSFIHTMLDRMEATPEQQQLIRHEIDNVMSRVRGSRDELATLRADIARAMRAPTLDETAMGEAFARQDDRLRDLRMELVGALARIHDALDESQRDTLADMLESARGRFSGPYR